MELVVEEEELQTWFKTEEITEEFKPEMEEDFSIRRDDGFIEVVQEKEETIKLKQLEQDIARLEKAILLIAEWTHFDVNILKDQGFYNQNESEDETGTSRVTHQVTRKSTRRYQKSHYNTRQSRKKKEKSKLGANSDDLFVINPNLLQQIYGDVEEKAASEENEEDHRENNDSDDNCVNTVINANPLEEANDNGSDEDDYYSENDDQNKDEDYVPDGNFKCFMVSSDHSDSDRSNDHHNFVVAELGGDVKNPDCVVEVGDVQSMKQYGETTGETGDGIKKVNGRKAYTCPFCGKLTPRKDKHIDHVRTHKGEAPLRSFPCDLCGHLFESKSSLKDHKKEVHNIESDSLCIRTCPICKIVLSNKYKLKRHIQGVHEMIRNVECHICNQRFKRKEYLQQHLIKIHGFDKVQPKKLPRPPESQKKAEAVPGSSNESNEYMQL